MPPDSMHRNRVTQTILHNVGLQAHEPREPETSFPEPGLCRPPALELQCPFLPRILSSICNPHPSQFSSLLQGNCRRNKLHTVEENYQDTIISSSTSQFILVLSFQPLWKFFCFAFVVIPPRNNHFAGLQICLLILSQSYTQKHLKSNSNIFYYY